MFAKLLHGLTATISRIKQLWTNENVPDGLQTLHDFRDGDGLVPAIPVDTESVSDHIVSFAHKKSGYRGNDNVALADHIISFASKNSGYRGNDNVALSDTILTLEVNNV